MATWPTTLPNPTESGYSLRPESQTIRTDMEVGPARMRRITSARNDSIALSWFMSNSQFTTFRAWFENGTTGLAGGVGWFTGMPLKAGDGIQTTLECRFTGPYEATTVPGGMAWTVSATVEVR